MDNDNDFAKTFNEGETPPATSAAQELSAQRDASEAATSAEFAQAWDDCDKPAEGAQ